MISSGLVRSALCAALLVALAIPGEAVAARSANPAEPAFAVRASAGVVHVVPSKHAPAWQLRVVGPDGKVAEDTLLDGEPMRIEPRLLGYARWLEGSYRFELVPVLGDRRRGNASAANAPSNKVEADVRSAGSFRVLGGKLVVAGEATEPAPIRAKAGSGGGMVTPADQVIPDDLIVQSSICVGFDCVNNESFGFDTIRMKENNTRIKFEDTSVGAFPSTDWQLTANESGSGGANRFSVEDVTSATVPFTVFGGAPTNTLVASSTGNIGVGTGVPFLDFHMTTSDTPAIRFEQTSAAGYTAQTWDIGANEANFFVRDTTGGSRLSLRIRPGAPTSSLDIAATGNVGMGTAAPATALQVERATGPVAVRLKRTGGAIPIAVAGWDMLNNTDTGRLTFSDDPAGLRVPFKLGRNANDNLLRVGVFGPNIVDVNGNLKVIGNIQVTGTVGPDYVFAPGFALPSIADHAAQMRRDRHLPKVGRARVEDGRGIIDLGALSHGMLEELEYAHLYIAQLDGTVQELRGDLAERDDQLARMRAEIDAIKAALAAD
jgi:hypothetical protein